MPLRTLALDRVKNFDDVVGRSKICWCIHRASQPSTRIVQHFVPGGLVVESVA